MQILSVRGAAAPATSPTSWPKNLAIPGPEDFVIDRAAHIAYLSSQDRSGSEAVMGGLLRMKANRWEVRGSIYQMDLNDPDLSLWQLADDFPKNKGFHPVGMDLHVNPDGSRRLFIVNWPGPNQYAVEIFDLETNRLRHVRTVAGKALTCPNDIAAVDGERFYVSNGVGVVDWHTSRSHIPYGYIPDFGQALPLFPPFVMQQAQFALPGQIPACPSR
jgi:hypothetical protein